MCIFGKVPLRLVARDDDRLMIIVDCNLEVDEAETRITKFCREWWPPNIAVEDRVGVTLHYIE